MGPSWSASRWRPRPHKLSKHAGILPRGIGPTHRFETYSGFLRGQVIRDQVVELVEARNIAAACGYGFVVGVSTQAHKDALEAAEPSLTIVATECKR